MIYLNKILWAAALIFMGFYGVKIGE